MFPSDPLSCLTENKGCVIDIVVVDGPECVVERLTIHVFHRRPQFSSVGHGYYHPQSPLTSP